MVIKKNYGFLPHQCLIKLDALLNRLDLTEEGALQIIKRHAVPYRRSGHVIFADRQKFLSACREVNLPALTSRRWVIDGGGRRDT